MTIDRLVVLITSLALSIFIYWYFLKRQEQSVTVQADSVDILVDGGYHPETIRIKKDQKVTLNFLRQDPSDCLQEVVLPEFGKKIFLPLHQKTPIEIQPSTTGTYEIACGMNMFHGKIIVEA